MYCKKCGKEIPDTAVFCTHCGAEVQEYNSIIDGDTRQPENEYGYRNTATKTHRFLFWLPAIIFIPLLIIAGVRANLNNRYTNAVPYVPPVSSDSEVSSIPTEEETYIGTVKDGYLSDQSTTVTVGQAFEKFFANPKWEYTESKGVHYVWFHGTAHNVQTERQVRVAFSFIVDQGTFNVDSWYYEEVPQNLTDLPDILNKVYKEVK